jgi:hypothetical protein
MWMSHIMHIWLMCYNPKNEVYDEQRLFTCMFIFIFSSPLIWAFSMTHEYIYLFPHPSRIEYLITKYCSSQPCIKDSNKCVK